MTLHLGILGGGQLGRMLAVSARQLGMRVTVLEPNREAPARATAEHIVAAYDDKMALEKLAQCDVVTFEFENVPEIAVQTLAAKQAVFPPALALRTAQDRWTEKNTFRELKIPTPRFFKVDSEAEAVAAFDAVGPLVLKTRRFGYDGKGQSVVRSREQIAAAVLSLKGAPAIAEELISFDRELSVLACRGQDGSTVVYPLTENQHKNGILRTSIVPARGVAPDVLELAHGMIGRLLEHFSYVGVLALELFQVGDALLANEFAPRVHNSGHWTIEAAITSQFENHVRAVCGLPLGSPHLRCPAVMTNLIGQMPPLHALLALDDTHVHDYEKAPRPDRKVGHVTSLAGTADLALATAKLVSALAEAPEQGSL